MTRDHKEWCITMTDAWWERITHDSYVLRERLARTNNDKQWQKIKTTNGVCVNLRMWLWIYVCFSASNIILLQFMVGFRRIAPHSFVFAICLYNEKHTFANFLLWRRYVRVALFDVNVYVKFGFVLKMQHSGHAYFLRLFEFLRVYFGHRSEWTAYVQQLKLARTCLVLFCSCVVEIACPIIIENCQKRSVICRRRA